MDRVARWKNWCFIAGPEYMRSLFSADFFSGSSCCFLRARRRMKRVPAAITAAMLAALIFSAFHYIGSTGDSFTLAGFLQRTFGGLFFSALFVTRGFGVTAASDALYDILAGGVG